MSLPTLSMYKKGSSSRELIAPALEHELEDFHRYLCQVCGLAASTCEVYRGNVRPFLTDCFGCSRVRIHVLRAQDIVEFFNAHGRRRTGDSMRPMAAALRSYLRFKALGGESTKTLVAAVPQIAGGRFRRLPRVLHAREVERFLRLFDHSRPIGQRDYAMARCCIDLGLRAAEVARLQLEDVDWRTGTLRIRGKNRRTDLLPLPRKLGNAICRYLRFGRPVTPSRAIFIRCTPPLLEPVNATIVRYAMRRAARRGRLGHRIGGTHILRHTLATRLLARGATLKQIADLLRHRSLNATTIYTKVDWRALTAVAMPWPGGVYETR